MSKIFQLKYYPQLDGLRGISILLVMLFHAKFPFFSEGFIGVDIFFVLSGFLITSILIKEFKDTKKINFKRFYIRRMRRLFPALLFFIFIYLVISWFLLDWELFYDNFLDSVIALFYMTNLAQALEYRTSNLLNHTWSLSVEEQFYLIYPVFIYFLLRKKLERYIY